MNSLNSALTDANKHVLLTPQQMYQADSLTIASGTSGVQLMANAGSVVVNAIMHRWPQQDVLVLCGTGNNGGDGFVVATFLKKAGWPVKLALYGDKSKISGDALWAFNQWQDEIHNVLDIDVSDYGLIVDAIFGAGLNRPIKPDLAKKINNINESLAKVCSVDIPTGVNGETGEILGAAIQADLTVTFFRPKPGHYLLPGKINCADIQWADIDIKNNVLNIIKPNTYANHPDLWLKDIPWPKAQDHKYTRGHVLVFGGVKLLGAARLVSLSAARIGAGLVTLAVPKTVWPIQAGGLTSVMVEELDNQTYNNLNDARRNVIVIGPGLGLDAKHKDLIIKILETKRACVLDADALSIFADDTDLLISKLHNKCVLTPHAGEFARLFANYGDKLSKVKNAATKTGAVVLLKGADTVIANPDGQMVINHNAPPYLATAGAGDVLAGAVAGLMASGMTAFTAACAGVWLHGQAASNLGFGLLAEDLPRQMPKALFALNVVQNG